MGLRGVQPKPTALKIARGNPGRRPINAIEPELSAASRAVPAGMTGKAKAEWNRLVDELVDSGSLTIGDMDAFEEYCYLVADVERYRRLIRKKGDEQATALGYANYFNKLRTQKRQQAAHLGLTSTSRASVKAAKVPKKDEAATKRARFFGKAG